MLDVSTNRGRIIAAAMRLAASKPWSDLTLLEIAEGAGLGLADLKAEFSHKSAILKAFTKAVDGEVLRTTLGTEAGQSVRDRLFEVVMRRFDVLGPYKTALANITRSAPPDPAFVRTYLCSQHWMLEAAGVRTDGIGTPIRLAGLASVYAQVFRTWLADDDPGHARTMAALDRRLRRGEAWLGSLDDACKGVHRMMDAFRGRRREGGAGSAPSPSAPPPQQGAV